MKIKKIKPERKKDRSDGKQVYIPKDFIGYGIIFEKSDGEEQYHIQAYGPEKIKQETRKAIIRINHRGTVNEKRKREDLHKQITIVLDSKNHTPQMPFHLNLTEPSKSIVENCNKCKKYFSKLNHSLLSYDEIDQFTKRINYDKIVEKIIKKELEKKRFRDEFPKIVNEYTIP